MECIRQEQHTLESSWAPLLKIMQKYCGVAGPLKEKLFLRLALRNCCWTGRKLSRKGLLGPLNVFSVIKKQNQLKPNGSMPDIQIHMVSDSDGCWVWQVCSATRQYLQRMVVQPVVMPTNGQEKGVGFLEHHLLPAALAREKQQELRATTSN